METTVLIVEDDPLLAQILETQLRLEGYRTSIAYHGLQALRISRDASPDLILLDLMLPGIDGFEVLNRLRAEPNTARTPVIVLSAKDSPSDRQMAARLGANGYLTKPYTRAELAETIRAVLQSAPARGAIPNQGILLIGTRGREAAIAGVRLGLALAQRAKKVVLVDFYPLSLEHFILLEMSAPPAPVTALDNHAALMAAATSHPSGLQLLGNLQGKGTGGELLPEDVRTVMESLLADGGHCVLADLPLYPIENLRRAADLAKLILVVFRNDAPSLAAVRSAFRLIEQAGLQTERVYFVALGSQAESPVEGVNRPVLGFIPDEPLPAGPSDPGLAGQLLNLLETEHSTQTPA